VTAAARAAALALLLALAGGGGAAGAEPIAGPRLDYVLECMGCHLEDGSGAPGRVPSLSGVGRFLRVPGGRAYLVRVPGVAHAPLDDAAVAALLNWLVARYDPPAAAAPGFAPFTAAEVAARRAAPLADATAERRGLLERLGGER
jgi:hypothetical protein